MDKDLREGALAGRGSTVSLCRRGCGQSALHVPITRFIREGLAAKGRKRGTERNTAFAFLDIVYLYALYTLLCQSLC